jgi:ribosomal protein L11 methyltransferase
VYGAPGELPALPALTAAAGEALVEVSTSEIPDDWERRWRAYHRPVVIDERLAVRPPWEPPLGTGVELVVDPGRAFGTGAHPTTRLSLEALLTLPRRGGFVDLGCGSGVLAIAAAKLGWAPVLALDHDAAAVEAARRNVQRNGTSLEVRRYDLRTDPVDASVAPTVVANLLAALLIEWAGRLARAGTRPERIVASGLLLGEGDLVTEAFAPLELRERSRRVGGDWLTLVLAR